MSVSIRSDGELADPMACLTALSGAAVGTTPDEAGAGALGIEIVPDVAAAEPAWQRLRAEGVLSPFQRPAWIEAYVAAVAPGRFEPRFVILSDAAGRPQMLLPLAIERRSGVRIASLIGAKQASFHLAPMACGLARRLPPADMRRVLLDIGRRLGIDAFAFSNVPVTWRGEANPLAGGGQPSPSTGWALTLAATAEESLARCFSKERRKKLRHKQKKLNEIGPLAYRVAATPAEADRMLAAFYAQKSERMRATGLESPFDEASLQAFFSAACRAGLDEGRPAIAMHALLAGERVLAVAGTACDAVRASCMFISYDADPDVARSSPGEILLTHVVDAQCRAGRATFDLGVGEAAYKAAFCPEPEPLVDVTVPVTWRGRVFTTVLDRFVRWKRYVKQTPRIWAAVTRLRAWKAHIAS